MKVTIEGDLDQVSAALGCAPKTPKQIRLAERAARQKVLIERRILVRRAFEKVRYSDADRAISEALLAALTRTSGVSESDLELARLIEDGGKG